MMDDLDRAAEYSAMDLWDAILRHYDGVEPSDGNGVCVDCGEDIPAERLKIDPGFRRCIACQQVWETTQLKG
jgi:phage/conjugal plasmid C-4 type zinc finger TraR family protein